MNRGRSAAAMRTVHASVLLASALCAATASACPEPAASGVQPCDGVLRTALANGSSGMLGAAGAAVHDISTGQGAGRHLISGRVPCVLVSAVAATESSWRHFNAACGSRGSTVVSFDCGYGIMQITSGMDGSGGFSPSRVAAEPAYDISVGVNILIGKWLAAGVIAPNDPNIAEDWYLALWGYNGFASINNPNQHSDTRGTYFDPAAAAFPRNHYPYQEIVYGYALHPQGGNDGMPRWASVRITHPNFSEICASCGFESGPLSAISPTHSGDCGSSTPDWAGTYVSQSFPAAAGGAIMMRTNESLPAYIEMRNTGGNAWDARTFLATTTPRDRSSVFVAPGWTSPERLAVAGPVAPGAVHRFNFVLHAPSTPGTFSEHFGMVEEGVTWFSDTGQGGPPDNLLEARIIVTEAVDAGNPPSDSGVNDAATLDSAVDAGGTDARTADGGGLADASRDARDGGTGPITGGCGCEIPGAPASRKTTAWVTFAAMASIVIRRRRRSETGR